jgi:hypothetical protein
MGHEVGRIVCEVKITSIGKDVWQFVCARSGAIRDGASQTA